MFDRFNEQVTKASVTYVSELFSITKGFEFAAGPWGNCSAQCGYGLRRREVMKPDRGTVFKRCGKYRQFEGQFQERVLERG